MDRASVLLAVLSVAAGSACTGTDAVDVEKGTGTLFGPSPRPYNSFPVTVGARLCEVGGWLVETTVSGSAEFEFKELESGCYFVDAEWVSDDDCWWEIRGVGPYEIEDGRYEVNWGDHDTTGGCPD